MPDLFDTYAPPAGRYDELLSADGTPRPAWRYLSETLEALGRDGLRQRQSELDRLLIEHGIAYKAYGKQGSRTARWSLDLLPMVIGSREWRDIEVGIAQRAELLRLILRDIYGPQTLIARGLLPAELVFGHAGYRMPCHGNELPLEHALILYAADLGRAPDGRFWVTGDRTQAPSGIGYALESRTIISRVLPSVFRECNVHPILPFMRAFRRCLVDLADGDPSGVALLTAGPANASYPEHAFLAHQLGVPLVEGADIEVVRGRAWLDRGDGRQALRAILRRMDDDFCDPLELNRQSLLGSAGLAQAERNRQLRFANPLGSSVVENPALMAFLPALCRELLGEPLRLPSVDTWWCGRPDDRAHVEANFDDMLIRSLRQGAETAPLAVATLNGERRQRLLDRLKARPMDFVAQPVRAQSAIPVLAGQQLSARPVELRSFAVSSGESFTVMAGGLARSARRSDELRMPSPLGGISKDVWIPASEPQQDAYTLPLFTPSFGARAQPLPALSVDKLIWFGRYASRVEILAGLLLETVGAVLEGNSADNDPLLSRLLQAVTWQTTLYPGFVGPIGAGNRSAPEAELLRVIADAGTPDSLLGAILATRENAESLRDLLSEGLWRQVNRLTNDIGAPQTLVEALPMLDVCHVRSLAIAGDLARSLHEGPARAFVAFGFGIESVLGQARLIRSLLCCEQPLQVQVSTVMLELVGSAGSSGLADNDDGARGLLFTLLFDAANPRSIRRQLLQLQERLRELPAGSSETGSGEHRLAALDSRFAALDSESLAAGLGAGGELDQQMAQLDSELRAVAEAVEQRAAAHRRRPAAQLVQTA